MPTTSSSAARVPVEERLFSLVLALLATESGLTKNDILSTVQGYRQRFVAGGDNSTLERQFERDKDDIRELGVPLETVEPLGEAGNNQTLRYRIPRGSYDLPRDIVFSSAELRLLALAATVWREGSLSAESRRALMKLRSLGVEADEPLVGYAPRLRVRESAFEPLSLALERHTVVTFPYLKPGEAAARVRTVEPYALVQHQGRWHVQGFDRSAGGPRTFLLSRIVGPVQATARTFVPEDRDYAAEAIAELDRIWERNVAEVEVEPRTDAAVRMNNRYGPAGESPVTRLRVHYTDINILADELAGYGPEVLVLGPRELREAVRTRLERQRRPRPGSGAGPAGDGRTDQASRPSPGRAPAPAGEVLQRAQDKLAFLLALVPYLMDHDRVSVDETAAHFGLTPGQIREAVRLIAISGIPGETSQYQHGDLFDIAWDDFEEHDEIVLTQLVAIDDSPRFSAREAAALIAGLQYLSSLPENADREAIGSLMARLARGASGQPSQLAVAGGSSDATSLAAIRRALDDGVQVEFDYVDSRGSHERRRVDPLRVESVDEDWYLRGWCHLREAVRTFRLDRMSGIRVTDDRIAAHPGSVALPETLFEGTPDDLAVEVEIAESALPLVIDYIPDRARLRASDGIVRTSLRVAHYHGLKRLAARLSGVLTVVGPEEARNAVAAWADAGARRYDGETETSTDSVDSPDLQGKLG